MSLGTDPLGTVPLGASLASDANISVPVAAGVYTLAGLVPVVVAGGDISVPVAAGVYTLAGLVPVVVAGDDISVPVAAGVYTVAGLVPVVQIIGSATISVPVGGYTLAGLAPVVTGDVTPDLTFGVLTPITSVGNSSFGVLTSIGLGVRSDLNGS